MRHSRIWCYDRTWLLFIVILIAATPTRITVVSMATLVIVPRRPMLAASG